MYLQTANRSSEKQEEAQTNNEAALSSRLQSSRQLLSFKLVFVLFFGIFILKWVKLALSHTLGLIKGAWAWA